MRVVKRQTLLVAMAIGSVLLLIVAGVFRVSASKGGANASYQARGATIVQQSKGAAIGKKLPSTSEPSQFPGEIEVSVGEGAELLLTDGSGRRNGFDPLTQNSFAEIPNASYADDSIDAPDDDSPNSPSIKAKSIEVSPVSSGKYTLTVTGTGTAVYDLSFMSLDPNFQSSQASVEQVPTVPGSRRIYQFTAPILAGGAFPLSGGFDGGGEKPEEVNRLLTYANPISSETSLPAGTATFTLLLFYDSPVIANSFSATLNQSPITGKLFTRNLVALRRLIFRCTQAAAFFCCP